MDTLIRLCALAAIAIVGLSFAAFAVDESGRGSDNQVKAVDGSAGAPARPYDPRIDRPDPPPAIERVREAEHGGLREAIDDGNDLLTSAFTGIVSSDNAWVNRLVPGGLALLLFGLGGLWIANLVPQRRRPVTDWREAHS